MSVFSPLRESEFEEGEEFSPRWTYPTDTLKQLLSEAYQRVHQPRRRVLAIRTIAPTLLIAQLRKYGLEAVARCDYAEKDEIDNRYTSFYDVAFVQLKFPSCKDAARFLRGVGRTSQVLVITNYVCEETSPPVVNGIPAADLVMPRRELMSLLNNVEGYDRITNFGLPVQVAPGIHRVTYILSR
jgi:hypothetical protein